MNPRALLSSVLVHLGLAATISSLVTSPALAQSAITAVRADACLDRPGLGVEWLDASNDAYDALPDTDARITIAQVLEPRFDGPRPFHEPSAFDTTTLATWDYTRFVADDATATAPVAEGKRDSSVLKLAGHAVYGMGRQVVVLTVGTAIGEIEDWWADPLGYYTDRIPGIAQVKQVWRAPETIPFYYEAATTVVPAKWNEFLAAKDYEQAETIGATAATIGVLLAPLSKGTGSAAADAQLARWSKLKNDALTSHLKNVKDPKAGALSFADGAPANTKVTKQRLPKRLPLGDAERLLSTKTDAIPHLLGDEILSRGELLKRFPNPGKLTETEMRAMIIEERSGRSLAETGEAGTRKLFGQKKIPNAQGGFDDAPTADFVSHGSQQGKFIPVETKAQNEVDLNGPKNSAAKKFKALAESPNASLIERFEVRVRTDSKLPPNFFVDEDGQLWHLPSGERYAEPWEFGGKPVYILRAAIGEES